MEFLLKYRGLGYVLRFSPTSIWSKLDKRPDTIIRNYCVIGSVFQMVMPAKYFNPKRPENDPFQSFKPRSIYKINMDSREFLQRCLKCGKPAKLLIM